MKSGRTKRERGTNFSSHPRGGVADSNFVTLQNLELRMTFYLPDRSPVGINR